MFTYTWAVTIESDVELSEDVANVIDDLKKEFADAVDAVLDIERVFEARVSSFALRFPV
jgi:hypothetical protein